MIEIKSNAILRDGETIGRIDGDTAVMSAMPPGVVKGQIRKAAGNAGLAFTVEATKDVVVAAQLPIAAEVMAKMMPDEPTQIIEKSTGLTIENLEKAKEIMGMTSHAAEHASAAKTIHDLEAAAEAGLIPMPPEKHPAMGDKTPAFVEWVRAHLSADDFQRHYHRRKIPASMQAFEAKDNLVTKRLNAAERNPETI